MSNLLTPININFPFFSNLSFSEKIYRLGFSTGQVFHSIFQFIQSFNTSTIYQYDNTHHHDDILSILTSYFRQYKNWWLELLQNDPVHVLIETVMLIFLLYLLFWKNMGSKRKRVEDRLNDFEIEELLKDWKMNLRQPLESSHDLNDDDDEDDNHDIDQKTCVVEKIVGSKVTLHRRQDDTNNNNNTNSTPTSSTVLNFATHDFLGMSCPELNNNNTNNDDDESKDVIKDASREALNFYGCGSCGPRGFYGTIDAHLELEDSMSHFCQTEGAILYSDGAAASSSTVAAFAKRGDLLIVDEGVYEALGTGITLSRANVMYFKHNDMNDLRRLLERVKKMDESLKRKSNDQRRFIVVEGLYKNYGTICPLDELIRLKEEFCYRLILDESFSFGVLGKTGKGVLEHYGLRHMKDAEIVIISLENALGSIGAVTVGNEQVVDHQRLSGAGYCFSASSPPFTASAAKASLQLLQDKPEMIEKLHSNITYFYKQLSTVLSFYIPSKVVVTSFSGMSPIVFLQLVEDESLASGIWDDVAKFCLNHGIFVVSVGGKKYEQLHQCPKPALRLTVTAKQSKEEIDFAIKVLNDALDNCLND